MSKSRLCLKCTGFNTNTAVCLCLLLTWCVFPHYFTFSITNVLIPLFSCLFCWWSLMNLQLFCAWHFFLPSPISPLFCLPTFGQCLRSSSDFFLVIFFSWCFMLNKEFWCLIILSIFHSIKWIIHFWFSLYNFYVSGKIYMQLNYSLCWIMIFITVFKYSDKIPTSDSSPQVHHLFFSKLKLQNIHTMYMTWHWGINIVEKVNYSLSVTLLSYSSLCFCGSSWFLFI